MKGCLQIDVKRLPNRHSFLQKSETTLLYSVEGKKVFKTSHYIICLMSMVVFENMIEKNFLASF